MNCPFVNKYIVNKYITTNNSLTGGTVQLNDFMMMNSSEMYVTVYYG